MVAVASPIDKCDRRFAAVLLASLIAETASGLNLYLRDKSTGKYKLFRAADTPFRESDRQRLLVAGHRQVYLQATDRDRYQLYLREHLSELLRDDKISRGQQMATLSSVARESLAEAFHHVRLDDTLQRVDELAEFSVELMTRDDFVASDMLGVLCHDYQTFTHSANVSFYCVFLAKELGISDAAALKEISAGGLLHDLGKLEIPSSILNKQGRLTDREFEIIKAHPGRGFRLLQRRTEVSRGQLMMVYQHHERIDGGGYPTAATKTEIHDWAKICTVADVFEALTSDRPYRESYNVAEAIQIMRKRNGIHFDEDVLKCWISSIARG